MMIRRNVLQIVRAATVAAFAHVLGDPLGCWTRQISWPFDFEVRLVRTLVAGMLVMMLADDSVAVDFAAKDAGSPDSEAGIESGCAIQACC